MAVREVTTLDNFNSGRVKWNENDLELQESKVTISGNETINGVKTFNNIPVIATDSPTLSGHVTSKQYVDNQISKEVDISLQRFAGSDATSVSDGAQFSITNAVTASETLHNGSVQVMINGVYYLSQTDQTISSGITDFHISGINVVIHDTSNGGTIDLIDGDSIGVYYQLDA